MTNTFRSLLITTVLTLPTAFGAEPALQDSEPKPGTTSVVVEYVANDSAAAFTFANELMVSGLRLQEDNTERDNLLKQAAETFWKLGNQETECSKDMLKAANSLRNLARIYPEGSQKSNEYLQKASELTWKYGHQDGATPQVIRDAANAFYYLAFRCYPVNSPESMECFKKAAELFGKSTTHNDATSTDFKEAAKGFYNISRQYPKDSPEREECENKFLELHKGQRP